MGPTKEAASSNMYTYFLIWPHKARRLRTAWILKL